MADKLWSYNGPGEGRLINWRSNLFLYIVEEWEICASNSDIKLSDLNYI